MLVQPLSLVVGAQPSVSPFPPLPKERIAPTPQDGSQTNELINIE